MNDALQLGHNCSSVRNRASPHHFNEQNPEYKWYLCFLSSSNVMQKESSTGEMAAWNTNHQDFVRSFFYKRFISTKLDQLRENEGGIASNLRTCLQYLGLEDCVRSQTRALLGTSRNPCDQATPVKKTTTVTVYFLKL